MMLAILKLKIMIILLIVLCISKNIESRNIEELFSQLEIEDKCGFFFKFIFFKFFVKI